MGGGLFLYSEDAQTDLLGEAAKISKIPVLKKGDDGRLIFIRRIKEEKDITTALENEFFSALIEEDEEKNFITRLKKFKRSSYKIFLSLNSFTVFHFNISSIISDVLCRKLQFSADKMADVKVCLHEALSNAIIHGNMEVNRNFDNIGGLGTYYTQVNRALDGMSENYPGKVDIGINWGADELSIDVMDDGYGYDFKNTIKNANPLLGQMGLRVIDANTRKMKVANGGTKISMNFSINREVRKEACDAGGDYIKRSLKQSKILIIDDNSLSRQITRSVFEKHEFTNIEIACDGEEGLRKTRALHPDLVLLDLMMPKVDGFEYCRRIRREEDFKDMPVFVLTAHSDPRQRNRAFEVGATDLVTKPISPEEVIARSMVHLENKILLKSLKEYKTLMDRELESAREMQNILVPSNDNIEDIKNQFDLNIDAHFQNCAGVGGDLWGMKKLSDHELSIYVVDFSGHGVSSALNAFRLHTMMKRQEYGAEKNPGRYLELLNGKLVELLPVGQFATMFYAIINTRDDKLIYSAASTPSPVLLRSSGARVSLINGSGFPLGAVKNAEYKTHRLNFSSGDMLMLYSDALVETKDRNGRFVKETDILDFIRKNMVKEGRSSSDTFGRLLDNFKTHAGDSLNDDLTINFYQRKTR